MLDIIAAIVQHGTAFERDRAQMRREQRKIPGRQ